MIWLNSATTRPGTGLPQPLLRRRRLQVPGVPALLALPLLAGCTAAPPVASPQLLAPPVRSPQPAPSPAAPAQAPASSGLTPLPSAGAVVAAVPAGRADPFLPLGVAGAGGTAAQQPLALPDGFRFQGVLRAAGEAQALVQFGDVSGALRLGDRGGRTTELLPAGWSVAAIDVDQGQLLLRQGRQTVKAEL